MNLIKEPNQLLEALKIHEKEIARLYEVYAETFPLYRSFWTELSKEEIEHANWIEKLQTKNGNRPYSSISALSSSSSVPKQICV